MDKILFKNKEQFDSYIEAHTGLFPPPTCSWFYDKSTGEVISELYEPEKYPCVGLIELKHDSNGFDYLDGDFVYLNDFEYK